MSPSMTAFAVAGITFGSALIGLTLLALVGWFREGIEHQLFLARMRHWTRLDEPTLNLTSPGSAGVGSSSSVSSIRALPPMRGADRRPERRAGGETLLNPDYPDAA